MLKEEFIERTGMEVTDEELAPINEMYCNAGSIEKDEFCEDYKKHHDSKLLSFFYDRAVSRLQLLSYNDRENRKNGEYLLKAISEGCTAPEVRQVCMKLIGEGGYLIYLIQNHIEPTEEERDLIVKRLSEK